MLQIALEEEINARSFLMSVECIIILPVNSQKARITIPFPAVT